MELVRNLHHYFSMHAQTVAASVKAGVDAISDPVPVVEEATRQAVCLAQKADTVILALGCHPMVCAKEEIDRTTLAEKISKASPNAGKTPVAMLRPSITNFGMLFNMDCITSAPK